MVKHPLARQAWARNNRTTVRETVWQDRCHKKGVEQRTICRRTIYVQEIHRRVGDFFGYCVTTDLDGDHVYSKFEVVGGQIGTSGGGRKTTFLGGTGKYKDIEGGYTYSAIYAPNVDDQLVGHIVGSGSYKIP